MTHEMGSPFAAAELDVLIVANFTGDDTVSNNRFNDLASRFKNRGAQVELVTSAFSHVKKTSRTQPVGDFNYTVTRLPEWGYRRNVSFARLISQRSFAHSVKAYLKRRLKAPNVLICAVPPPEVGRVCADYARSCGAIFVVDIQDLWPDAFKMVASAPEILEEAFLGMRRASKASYEAASLIVGVSQTYLQSARKNSHFNGDSMVVYLGTELRRFDQLSARSECRVQDALPKVVYAGSLSRSYDLPVVIDAMRLLGVRRPSLRDLELVVLGDGAFRQEFESYAKSSGVNARFHGRLAYPDMVEVLTGCDIAVNPIVRGSAGSILNKAGDYAAAGLPVVNTQESDEYRQLLDLYQAGINCPCGDSIAVSAAIQRLVDSVELREEMGRNGRRMAEELFDRERSYEGLVDRVIGLAR